VSGRQALLEAAEQLGLPAADVEPWLGSADARDEVALDDQEAKSRRVLH